MIARYCETAHAHCSHRKRRKTEDDTVATSTTARRRTPRRIDDGEATAGNKKELSYARGKRAGRARKKERRRAGSEGEGRGSSSPLNGEPNRNCQKLRKPPRPRHQNTALCLFRWIRHSHAQTRTYIGDVYPTLFRMCMCRWFIK